MQTLPPLTAQRIARGDTRELMVVATAEGAIRLLFVSKDGDTGKGSTVEAFLPAEKVAAGVAAMQAAKLAK